MKGRKKNWTKLGMETKFFLEPYFTPALLLDGLAAPSKTPAPQ